MSRSAATASKLFRRSCQVCHDRKARFRYLGEVRADRDHVLCFACFRSERDRARAHQAAAPAASAALSPFLRSGGGLTTRQVAHRRQMLAHMAAAGTLTADAGSSRPPD